MVDFEFFEVFNMRKVLVKISAVDSNSDIMQFNDRECTLITTALINYFTKSILARRFAQINSLIKTDPRNIMRKLTKYELLNSIEFTGHMKIPNAKVYIWETNNGNKVYIIPPLHVMFKTQRDNCYVVEYPVEDLMF